MFQLSQSPFLQALGYTIVNSLWQFAFLWLIYLMINCVANMSSHKKYAAAISLQLAGFVWFIVTFIFYYNKCTYLASTGSVFNGGLVSFGQMPYTGSLKDRILLGILRTEVFLPYLSVAYLAIFLLLIIKWIEALRFSRAIRVNGLEKIDVQFRLFIEGLSNRLGIKRKVKVFLSHHVKSPLTIGFLKPIILIPFASLNNLSCEQVEAVLLHELAHIKRSDYLINLVLSVVEVVLFFNPFMQLISGHIKRERENSCDDWVLQFEYNASNYAKALLAFATFNNSRINSLAMKAVDQKHSLLIRVKRMIEKKDRTFNYRNQLVTLLALAGLMSVMAWITPRSKQQNIASANGNQLFVPMAAKIDNPFFNPVFFLAEKTQPNSAVENQSQPKSTREVSIFKISLPAFKNLQVQEEAIIKAAAEATAAAIEVENVSTRLALVNKDIDAPIALAQSNMAVVENLNVQWDKLNYQLKELETNLKHSSINALESIYENKNAKEELRKALQSLKASVTKAAENKIRNKKLLLSLLPDSAEIYFTQIFNEKTLAGINGSINAQLHEISAQNEAAAQYNNWKFQDKPGTMMYAPGMERTHIFSYDYRENPNLVSGIVTNDPQADDVEKANVDINESPGEVIEIHISPRAKGENRKVKKIIKRIRI